MSVHIWIIIYVCSYMGVHIWCFIYDCQRRVAFAHYGQTA